MAFLELDIRTLLRALVLGNLVAMAMVFAYKSPGNHVVPMRQFVLSRLFQAVGLCLLSQRGEIPLWLSAHVATRCCSRVLPSRCWPWRGFASRGCTWRNPSPPGSLPAA